MASQESYISDSDELATLNGTWQSNEALIRERNQLPPRPGMQQRLPQLIVIGVRKCGTRALIEFLNIHSAIAKARDEVHFFDDDSKYALGLQWYRQQMPYSTQGQVTSEKSPAYFVTEAAPQRIQAMNASIKLLVIVRDPVTRLISDYAQLAENKARKSKRNVSSFESLVLLPSSGEVNIDYKPVQTSIYALYYWRWMRTFAKEQIHVVDGDRLVYDPFPEVQRVEQFLGVRHEIRVDNFAYNATKGFYCVRILPSAASNSKCIETCN